MAETLEQSQAEPQTQVESGAAQPRERPNPPLIGITNSEIRRPGAVAPTPEGEPPRHEIAVGLGYLRAIERAGGLPVIMPPVKLNALQPLLDQLSGVCLPGGPDVSPRSYGGSSSPNLGPTEPSLDGFELAVARLADMRGMPILAIARGMQVLNVVRGGTLHQHIPEISTAVDHRQRDRGDVPTHDVELRPGSRLAEMLGERQLAVNSFHHQAVDQLGQGLIAVAEATDGTIEAVEDEGRDFVVGVQWNADLLAERPGEQGLFKRFIEASSGRS